MQAGWFLPVPPSAQHGTGRNNAAGLRVTTELEIQYSWLSALTKKLPSLLYSYEGLCVFPWDYSCLHTPKMLTENFKSHKLVPVQ